MKLRHNSRLPRSRSPFGAVEVGTTVTLSLEVYKEDAAGITCTVRTWVDGEAVVLALGDHQPPCQCVAELGGQREPPLVVELWRVGAEKHLATSRR